MPVRRRWGPEYEAEERERMLNRMGPRDIYENDINPPQRHKSLSIGNLYGDPDGDSWEGYIKINGQTYDIKATYQRGSFRTEDMIEIEMPDKWEGETYIKCMRAGRQTFTGEIPWGGDLQKIQLGMVTWSQPSGKKQIAFRIRTLRGGHGGRRERSF